MNNQEPTRECCGTCRQVVKMSMTSTSMPTEQGYETIQCSDQFCPNCHWTPICHSIKPSKELCEKCMRGEATCPDCSIKPPVEKIKVMKPKFPDSWLSPELSWEEKYEELRKNCAGHYDISLPPEVKSFIKKVEQQAVQQYAKEMFYKMKDFEKVHFNSGRASMVEDFKQFIENAPYGVITKTDMDDILQALKNKETKE